MPPFFVGADFQISDVHCMPIQKALRIVCDGNPFIGSPIFQSNCKKNNIVILVDLLAYVFNPSKSLRENVMQLLEGGMEIHADFMIKSILASHEVLPPGFPVYVTWIEDGKRSSYDCVMAGSPLGGKEAERNVRSATGIFDGMYVIDMSEDEVAVAWNKPCFQGDALMPVVNWGGGRYTGSITLDGRPHGDGELQMPHALIKGVWNDGTLVKTHPSE